MTASHHPDVPEFGRRFLDGEDRITRIGAGALGGKASSLVVVQRDILGPLASEATPGIEVMVPTLCVLTTDVFESFMEQNDLHGLALSDAPDDRLAHAFQRARLPAQFLGDLRALIARVKTPLAVRSSSRLEDALDHPFAGVYATKMIPNHQPDIDTRFRRLVEAIKFVYASTFFREARQYLRSVGQPETDEAMAVIIQEVVGQRSGDRFYPDVSGVARSYSYYPTARNRPEDGVVDLALGLGKTIVDGGLAWIYCPTRPAAPPPFKTMGDMLKNTQKDFWAVNMGPSPPPDPIRETEYLVRPGLEAAEADGRLALVASTYDAAADRLRPGVVGKGPRLLNFAPILDARLVPLNEVLRRLLDQAEAQLGSAVEIEFAMTLDRAKGVPARLGFLQVRPMRVSDETVEVSASDCEGSNVLLATDSVLGNGRRDDLCDVVFVKPDTFEARHTRRCAFEIDRINRTLQDAGRPYLLIGFGRWGSSDPWLGIPVEWSHISGARVIVEATLPEMNPDLSQGSHFFHNLISFKVLYLSVPHRGDHGIDWDWLRGQETMSETDLVQHVRTAVPLEVRVDGRNGRGVVLHDG